MAKRFTLGNCLFGPVKLTKNVDPDKHKYSGYSIGKNVIIFGFDNSSSVHIVVETNTRFRQCYNNSRS